MKKTIIMMLLALVAFCASAETYSYLRFTYNDASEVAYSVDGIVVTYDDTNIYVTNAEGTATLAIADVTKMYFSNDGTSSTGGDDDHIMTGDVNHDGKLDITDVTLLIDYVLGNNSDTFVCPVCGEVDGTEGINIGDVTALIDLVLGNGTTTSTDE